MEYNITHKIVLDLYNEIESGRLILAPYYQRNFVWRVTHQKEFIKTILLGYPTPQIFIAKGDMDVVNLKTTQAIVDGQQRLTTLKQFINNKFDVEGQYFEDLEPHVSEKFLNYKVPVIFMNIDRMDKTIKDIFSRLNRTAQTLSTIEKLASEFSASEIMLVAKLITKEIDIYVKSEDKDTLKYDPFIDKEFYSWAKTKNIDDYSNLLLEGDVFSSYQISRQEHLLFTLNIINCIISGVTNRNITKKVLEQFSDELPDKDEIVERLNSVANDIKKMNFKKSSYWRNKANMFSLVFALYENYEKYTSIEIKDMKKKLIDFEENIPAEYSIAAKEGVNNKKERLTRNKYITELLFN